MGGDSAEDPPAALLDDTSVFERLNAGPFIINSYENVLALGFSPVVYVTVVSATVAALFGPFAVLLVSVLRIATIARRTAISGR